MAREPGSFESRFPLRRDGVTDSAPAADGRPTQGKRDRREPIWRPGMGSEPSPSVPGMRHGGYAPGPGGGLDGEGPPPTSPDGPAPGGGRRIRWSRWIVRGLAAAILLFVALVIWLAITAPLSKSLRPPAPPSITLLADDGAPIARRGAVIGAPIDAAKLPPHVREAFIAIEDRRFYSHWGIDPRGITRALLHNLIADGGSQGGSTITQQLAKNAFLTAHRTLGRKAQEVMIAFWLEAWLSKDAILSRYLSNVYFGDNVYGLRAAADHYFSTTPERLTLSQATLLAGLVKAPSRLAPTGNLGGARDRQRLVIGAMVAAGFITPAAARRIRPAVLHVRTAEPLPSGTYFADWVLPEARDRAGGVATEQMVRTTLDVRLQKVAERAVKGARLGRAQVALVAMRPDGRVLAMVGGRDYGASPFNRATQARRQPGSAFKLFVYLAALRSGMTPDTMVDDKPVTIGEWKPANSDGRYAGRITLRQALAKSSNVVAARLIQQLGVGRVTQAARDLGISTPIGNDASIALGTSTGSLLELTAAYAAVANGSYPVRPHGLDETESADDWLARRLGGPTRFDARLLDDLRSMLGAVIQSGTGRAATLPIPAFGKTGTTQDGRDALFLGWAGDLVVGVWIGNDDNSPIPGAAGGGLPARIWRDFMIRALGLTLPPSPPEPAVLPEDNAIDLGEALGNAGVTIDNRGVQIDLGRLRDLAPEGELRDRIPRTVRIPAPPAPPPEERPRRDSGN